MLGLSLWEGRLPGQKTIENEDKGSHCSYRPESNFGTSDTVGVRGRGCRVILDLTVDSQLFLRENKSAELLFYSF